MFSCKRACETAAEWILIGVAAILAMRFYYVREMLAALALFSVLFGCVAAMLAVLFIFDRAGRAATEFLELRWKGALQQARAWRGISEPRSWRHR